MPLGKPYTFGQSFEAPFTRALMRGMPALGPAPPDFPELPEEEATPLKEKLLQIPVSGLHYAGGTLDKAFGGRALRAGINAAMFGGSPRDVLSAIPFSDTLGITRPEDSVSGQELLHKAGYHPERGNWAERNLAGPALEMALDPGTYLSFGPKAAATGLGKLMQRGGHVADFTHPALMKGFEATAPGLRAAGHGSEAIEEMIRRGTRVASDEAVQAAAAHGFTDITNKPLSRLAGVGLPFREPIATFGEGPLSQAIAQGFEVAKTAAKAAPVIRNVRAMIESKVGRQSHPGSAQAFETGMVPTREAIEAGTRYGEHWLRSGFDTVQKAVGDVPGFEHEAHNVMRGLAEGVPQFRDPARAAADLARRHALDVTPGVADPNAVSAAIGTHFPALQKMADHIRTRGQEIFKEAKMKGLPQTELGDDWINYVMRRYIGATPGFQGTDQARFLATTSGSNLARSKKSLNIPGGTPQLQEWAMNPALVGPAAKPKDQIAAHVAADMKATAMLDRPGLPLSADEAKVFDKKAPFVADWLAEVPHGHATGPVKIPYYSPDVIGDVTSRGLRHARTSGAVDALNAGIKGMARHVSEFPNPADSVNLNEFLRDHVRLEKDTLKGGRFFERPLTTEHLTELGQAGFRDRAHAEAVGSAMQFAPPGFLPPGISPAEAAAFQGLGQGLQNRLVREHLHAPTVNAHLALAGKPGISPHSMVLDDFKDPAAEIGQYALHRRDAAALAGMMNNWVTPTEMQPFMGWMKSYQNLFKNSVYPMWIASHVKNAATALYNNFLHGTNLGDYVDAQRIRAGGAIDPKRYAQVAHLGPQEAAQELRRLAYAHAKVGAGIGSFEERVGGRGIEDEHLQMGLEGKRRLTPYAALAAPHATLAEMWGQKGAITPWHQAGVGGGPLHQAVNKIFRGGAEALPYAEDRFIPLRMGRGLGTRIEDEVRLANYLGNLRQGMAPSNAGLLTRGIHFDYQDLSEMEQKALKNVIPFYTFLRRNLPYQIQMAFERPSAVTPTLRAMGATGGSEWVPEYMASGAHIPIGGEHEGQQQYLTSLGLPVEEAFQRMKFYNQDLPFGLGQRTLPAVGPTLMGLAGSLNPILKGLPEYFSNTQFYSGRKLTDLDTHGPASLWGQIPEEYARPIAQILANSPLARFVTTARTWTDPRKSTGAAALNTLTGFRLSDVDMAKQRAIAARKELEAGLETDPHLASFTNYFPRRDLTGPLPEELVQRLRLFTLMKNEAKAAALQRQRAAAGY